MFVPSEGVEIKAKKGADGRPLDGIPFHPYYTVHDVLGVAGFLLLFSAVIFFAPELGGYFLEYNNFIPADPLKTPAHIAPVWYFTPYYSMLRATTDPMVNVICVLVGLGAVGALVKGGLSGAAKIVSGAPVPAAHATPAAHAVAPTAPAKKKLSYNEQREFDGIEAAIAAAEKKHADLEAKLNDPKLVADHAAYAKACDAAGAAQAEIARLYARWEELERKRG